MAEGLVSQGRDDEHNNKPSWLAVKARGEEGVIWFWGQQVVRANKSNGWMGWIVDEALDEC